MSDPKLQNAYKAAEEKRRRAAILKDNKTMDLDFDIVTNPGIYAEDPVWKRFWKVEGIRAVNPDGSIITDAMERFRQAFGFGASYMEAEQENRLAILREQIISLQVDLAEQNDENELLAITNRHLAAELAAVKKSLKNYTGAIEAL
jgi:hypothetical protein